MGISVVIPTYNEAKNIVILIEEIEKKLTPLDKDLEIIVVDDNSPDGTTNIAEKLNKKYKNIRVLCRKDKKGLGTAVSDGYDLATKEIIISTDADLSFRVEDMIRLVEKIKSGYDLVVGSRHVSSGGYEKKGLRIKIKWAFSSMGNFIIPILTGVKLHDFTANFRAIRKEVWKSIDTKDNSNAFLLEMIIRTHYRGFKVGEIPVKFRDRRFGESKLQIKKEAPRFLAKLIYFAITIRLLGKS